MLLTRYELQVTDKSNVIHQGGLFRGDITLRDLKYFDNASDLDNAIMDFSRLMNKKLHVPEQSEFLICNKPSDKSLFYFTEAGYSMFKDDFKKLNDAIENNTIIYASEEIRYYNVKLIKIELNLSDEVTYNCYYQDSLQMCIELNR